LCAQSDHEGKIIHTQTLRELPPYPPEKEGVCYLHQSAAQTAPRLILMYDSRFKIYEWDYLYLFGFIRKS